MDNSKIEDVDINKLGFQDLTRNKKMVVLDYQGTLIYTDIPSSSSSTKVNCI